MAETELQAQRRVQEAIKSGITREDLRRSKDDAGFSMKSRLYVYVHARRTGAIPGGPVNSRNPTDCADAIIASHAGGRSWQTNKGQIAFFANKSVNMPATATGEDGIPLPFCARGSEFPLHTLSGEEGKRACARFVTPDGHILRDLSDTKDHTPSSLTRDKPLANKLLNVSARLPEEVIGTEKLIEGAARQITVNAYERNAKARQECIEAHGATCCICKFDFGERYGLIADGYIHVHHIKPLSEVREEYHVNPVEDLRPVCPNCHAVIHLNGECRSIDEVKKLLTEQK